MLETIDTFPAVIPKRPINADVPTSEEEKQPPPTQETQEETDPRGVRPYSPSGRERTNADREPKPVAPKLLAGLVVLALVFIVAAIVWGTGGRDDSDTAPTPAPVPSAAGGGGAEAEAPVAQTAAELGYPAFATANTTRIGGSDPASNAAAAALAVFPSTTSSQRPAAVTLVDEEDWAGAIAAAVFMAPPVRAPLLFSNSEEMPEVSAEALTALDPDGSRDTGGASLFAVGVLDYPGKAAPIDAGDPAGTAAQIATLRNRLFGEPPDHILVASSSRPDFAMPAAAWAARSGDPVLYTGRDKLSSPTANLLGKHPSVPVYVLGPAAVISPEVLREIKKIVRRAKRVAGKDPVANALALARYDDGDFGWDLNDPGHGFVLARDDSPADAAAAAPLSAAGTWGPLLLTDDASRLPAAVRDYFLDVKPGYTTDPTRAFYNHVWVIGDQEAIDVNQQAEVDELAELAKIGDEE
jgi:hypothetical protein